MSDGDDFSTGMGALLGRSIGELNGLQRRVDLLEKQLMKMQERQHTRAARGDVRLHAILFFLQFLIMTGFIAGITTWPAIRNVL